MTGPKPSKSKIAKRDRELADRERWEAVAREQHELDPKRLKQKADSLKKSSKNLALYQENVKRLEKLSPTSKGQLAKARKVIGEEQVKTGRAYSATVDSLAKARSKFPRGSRRIGV